MNTVNVRWNEGMEFTSEVDGHEIIIDAKEEFGGKNAGPRPKPLILTALGGCTGMDVVSILKKMKQVWQSTKTMRLNIENLLKLTA